MNLIEQAVLPLKEDAMARAESQAMNILENCRHELEEAYFDIDKAAPHPHGRMSRADYKKAAAKRSLFWAICIPRYSSYKMNDPHYVNIDPGKEKKFIQDAREDAAYQYDAFVAKLVNKIGEVTKASLDGNHVWSYSILTIEKPDGTTQRWKTQMIINVSKYGKLFNQFPTRMMKR